MVTTTSKSTKTTPTHHFHYGYAKVSDLKVFRMERTPTGRAVLHELLVDERPVKPTKRFWRSFFSRFGIAENVFRYFEPNEVFKRITERSGDSTFRYCIENRGAGADHLLAVTNTNRPVIRYEEIRGLLKRFGGSGIKYNQGLVTSTHQPRGYNRRFDIGADEFQDRFTMETPIDGFGHPRLFLSLLRTVCSNGAIGYSRAFRSDIPVGKNMDHCIARALESFDNGDGYVALRQRFESAQTSFASVRESLTLSDTVGKLSDGGQLNMPGLATKSRRMAGNLTDIYGLANLEALSDKRRRVLPAKCRVYDLINFASEVATHHAKPDGAKKMQAYIGNLISDEYDLEGTASNTEFDAFFMPKEDAPAELPGNPR